jgi:hypothetical protein
VGKGSFHDRIIFVAVVEAIFIITSLDHTRVEIIEHISNLTVGITRDKVAKALAAIKFTFLLS